MILEIFGEAQQQIFGKRRSTVKADARNLMVLLLGGAKCIAGIEDTIPNVRISGYYGIVVWKRRTLCGERTNSLAVVLLIVDNLRPSSNVHQQSCDVGRPGPHEPRPSHRHAAFAFFFFFFSTAFFAQPWRAFRSRNNFLIVVCLKFSRRTSSPVNRHAILTPVWG